jgi:hypothetical protein
MVHHGTDTIDADLGILCFAVPQSPVQPLDFRDDHRLRRGLLRIIGRQAFGDLLQMLEPHADMKPVEDRHLGDASIGENEPQPGATIGEGRQFRVVGCSDGIQALADQYFDVRIRLGDGAKNLPPTRPGFDIADLYLQGPRAVPRSFG